MSNQVTQRSPQHTHPIRWVEVGQYISVTLNRSAERRNDLRDVVNLEREGRAAVTAGIDEGDSERLRREERHAQVDADALTDVRLVQQRSVGQRVAVLEEAARQTARCQQAARGANDALRQLHGNGKDLRGAVDGGSLEDRVVIRDL